ncbi:MAG: SDR family NAD(P)-dependent oxidoreductase [Alphaproteobacteria bacterium]
MRTSVVVTGGSRGIGKACVLAIAARGHSVVFSYLTGHESAKSVLVAVEEKGGRARAVQADMASRVDVERLFATADEEGQLVGLVNNAGQTSDPGPFIDMSANQIERIFDVNVIGAMDACRAAVRRMSTSTEGGGIVNLTSQAATFGGNGIAAYAASKAALQTFTVALAREVGCSNVRVNAVSPGMIETDMLPSTFRKATTGLPLGRLGTPGEVAAAVEWLLLDAPKYITGAVVPVAGAR